MNKVISVVAMCAGSFLLGGSLGLALSSYSCKLCMTEGDLDRIKDKIIDELTEDEDVLPGIEDLENIERAFKPEDIISIKGNWKKLNNIEQSSEFDEEVISTVEDLVESYISKNDERPELEDATDEEISEEPVTDDQEDSGDIIIVSTDSYLNEYEDYDKNTLTYYAGDDILVDSRDDVVFDTDEYVGPEALDKFGEGSDDENVVYVRNFNKKADYEIIRDEGTFRETVLGYTSEYKLTKKKNLNDEESEE